MAAAILPTRDPKDEVGYLRSGLWKRAGGGGGGGGGGGKGGGAAHPHLLSQGAFSV